MGMATSRSHARQLVAHGHVMVNGRKTKAPSALVTPGDVISIRPESMGRSYFKTLRQDIDDRQVPRWISLDTANMTGKVLNLPVRDDIDVTINEQLVVEYYSRR
jgi:small subunit ribosomal protein S4